MVDSLPNLPHIKQLSPRVVRILGGNPGKFSLQGTNTYLVGQGPKRILIDTGEGKAIYRESLQEVLRVQQVTIDQVILTHWHPDHVGGVRQVLELCQDQKPIIYKNQPDPGQTNFVDGHVFKTEGATLQSFHCPGHTHDHMSLILLEEDAMFTGDNVLGHGTAVFEDLPAYMNSLERMQHQFGGRAYPGHGEVLEDGRAKIHEYITHRKKREQEILNLLMQTKADGQETWQSLEMVRIIYKDYPENLHLPAEGGLKQVLKKLKLDGKVVEVEEGIWKMSEKSAL